MHSFSAAIEGAKITYRLARMQSMTEWWHWLTFAVIFLGLVTYVIWMYRRDGVDLPKPISAALMLLRILAFVGLAMFFLDLEKRTERSVTKVSRLIVLADTSQSMTLPDGDPASSQTGPSRIERLRTELADGRWLRELRAKHDVVVYRFDQGAKPTEVAAFSRLPDANDERVAAAGGGGVPSGARRATMVALATLALAVIAGLLAAIPKSRVVDRSSRSRGSASGEPQSWAWLVAVVAGIFAFVILSVVKLRYPELTLMSLIRADASVAPPSNQSSPSSSADKPGVVDDPKVDWEAQLRPSGFETRIGDAIKYVVNKERNGSIAGIVLATDGANNAGGQVTEAMTLARQAHIPIYPIGFGSDKRPVNVRVVDLEAPSRVYPGDRFTLSGFVQSYGFEGRTVRVELLSRAADKAAVVTADKFEEEQRIKLPADGQVTVIKFEVTPADQGRREFRMKVHPPEQDGDATDNEKSATVQVVERRTKVLLVAGGPMRDFQFLRNMLHRERETDVDVFLQIGKPGISQDADNILFEFPKTADELFKYDAIVAYDPAWTSLDELQVELLDRWIAEKAGGLVVLAGPVNTPQWASRVRSDAKLDKIQALYPVVFYSRGSATLSLGKFGATTPWPIQFTRDGLESEFLWLEDSASANEQAWGSFPGVYGYYAVKGAKPGARVFARFSDPDTATDGELPVYMAGHFYGAGRVFFMGSGEMWRLRGTNEKYFDTYYLKLIRWVSQGRLLRDSSRGVLLIEKERCLLGDDVEVRAMLSDAQHQPLRDETVTASLLHSDGTRTNLVLRRQKDSAREGSYFGTFTAQRVGDYRIELRPPEGNADELLVREVRVLSPQLETERPERNDALLTEFAIKTGGQYYVGIEAAVGRPSSQRAPVASVIEPNNQDTFLPGTPDRDFEMALMTWLMGLICGVLCVEWLIRRLSRLA